MRNDLTCSQSCQLGRPTLSWHLHPRSQEPYPSPVLQLRHPPFPRSWPRMAACAGRFDGLAQTTLGCGNLLTRNSRLSLKSDHLSLSSSGHPGACTQTVTFPGRSVSPLRKVCYRPLELLPISRLPGTNRDGVLSTSAYPEWLSQAALGAGRKIKLHFVSTNSPTHTPGTSGSHMPRARYDEGRPFRDGCAHQTRDSRARTLPHRQQLV